MDEVARLRPLRPLISDTSQTLTIRLVGRGLTHFEVLGRKDDRELVRVVAKPLAEYTQGRYLLDSNVLSNVTKPKPWESLLA
jgi:hypothetical protein